MQGDTGAGKRNGRAIRVEPVGGIELLFGKVGFAELVLHLRQAKEAESVIGIVGRRRERCGEGVLLPVLPPPILRQRVARQGIAGIHRQRLVDLEFGGG